VKTSALAASLIVLLVSGCAPSNTPQPTGTPRPTAAATPTELPSKAPLPAVTVTQATPLFAGPGNDGFEVLADLPAGTQAFASGTVGDFVRVSTDQSGTTGTGYVWKNALTSVPSDLAAVPADQVPLMPLYLPSCSPGTYTSETATVTFANDSGSYRVTGSKSIPLTQPLRISVGAMSSSGTAGPSIHMEGIASQTDADWWKGITSLEFGSANGKYFLGFRDGSKQEYGYRAELALDSSQAVQIQFDQPQGKTLRVLDGGGKTVQSIDLAATPGLSLPGGLFPNGVVFIGMSIPPKSTFTLTNLQIGVDASGRWNTSKGDYFSKPGLAKLAAGHDLTIGAMFTLGLTSDLRYCQTMKREFNLVALGEFSAPGLWLGPGQYDWSSVDAAVDYATRQGWRIRASHLLWGEPGGIPDWLKQGTRTRDQYIQIMQQYIRDVVARYKGRVQEWSIANEASIRSLHSPVDDFWHNKIGPEYIAIAFRTAREVDPNGVLIFNDVDNQAPQDGWTTAVINKMYSTVKQLKAQGVPIDGVGMQMHLFMPWDSPVRVDKAAVEANMRKFAALGVQIYVTEMDVDLERQTGSQADKWALEAAIYKDVLEACLGSGACRSLTTWGFSDSDSWISCESAWCLKDKNADPLPFDVNFEPKPAYFALRDALR
jgi:endo-1,4-beta-xylanase